LQHTVSMAWLKEHLFDEEVRIIDCRFLLADPLAGRKAYEQSHIPGAVYFDLDQDLSGPVGEHGGRHPLPDLNELANKLGQAGIDGETTLVAYDDQGGPFASRFWWLLRYMGHPRVYVLDGSISAWQEEGNPVTSEIPIYSPKTFTPNIQPHLVATMEEVRNKLHQSHVTLIDSREPKRYLGVEEPIDPVAGHIPGARNYFWKQVTTEKGGWKGVEELQEHFKDIQPDDEIIVYCGSGVTACPNVLGLEQAGYKKVKLYAGSWSDWITNSENPVEKGKS
jgi:thiosulfate/3-mercaptopyruvate sulfurtransferase